MINEGPVSRAPAWWWWWSCAMLSLSQLSLFSQFIPSISTNDPSSASCHSKTLNQYIATSKHAVLLQPFIKRHLYAQQLMIQTEIITKKSFHLACQPLCPDQNNAAMAGWAGLGWAGLGVITWASNRRSHRT